MQALYALRQAEFSNQQMALDGINDLFQPDLNSMLPQDKRQLEGYRKLASLLFEEAIKTNQSAKDDDAPNKVLKAANDGFVFYQIRTKKRSAAPRPDVTEAGKWHLRRLFAGHAATR
uniref:hypothetical protein n=1 Tax=Spirosoma foliorum TaxID=2710596 RepID=UPI001F0AD358|nr:hypothetical protein [Spirosoma foliorum]